MVMCRGESIDGKAERVDLLARTESQCRSNRVPLVVMLTESPRALASATTSQSSLCMNGSPPVMTSTLVPIATASSRIGRTCSRRIRSGRSHKSQKEQRRLHPRLISSSIVRGLLAERWPGRCGAMADSSSGTGWAVPAGAVEWRSWFQSSVSLSPKYRDIGIGDGRPVVAERELFGGCTQRNTLRRGVEQLEAGVGERDRAVGDADVGVARIGDAFAPLRWRRWASPPCTRAASSGCHHLRRAGTQVGRGDVLGQIVDGTRKHDGRVGEEGVGSCPDQCPDGGMPHLQPGKELLAMNRTASVFGQ